jgi:hypothetical protein
MGCFDALMGGHSDVKGIGFTPNLAPQLLIVPNT